MSRYGGRGSHGWYKDVYYLHGGDVNDLELVHIQDTGLCITVEAQRVQDGQHCHVGLARARGRTHQQVL